MSAQTHLRSEAHHKPASPSSAATLLLQRKCACGSLPGIGGMCPDCRSKKLTGQRKPIAQAKLTISQPGDRHERDADRVADAVVRMPAPSVQWQPELNESVEEGTHAQPDSDTDSHGMPGLESRIYPLLGGGRPLDPVTRGFMEPRFHRDFSSVRIHTSSRAAEAVAAANAKALAIGNEIFFGAGYYSPETVQGRRLIAHELAHAVQQRNPGSGRKGARRPSSSEVVQSNLALQQRGHVYGQLSEVMDASHLAVRTPDHRLYRQIEDKESSGPTDADYWKLFKGILNYGDDALTCACELWRLLDNIPGIGLPAPIEALDCFCSIYSFPKKIYSYLDKPYIDELDVYLAPYHLDSLGLEAAILADCGSMGIRGLLAQASGPLAPFLNMALDTMLDWYLWGLQNYIQGGEVFPMSGCRACSRVVGGNLDCEELKSLSTRWLLDLVPVTAPHGPRR